MFMIFLWMIIPAKIIINECEKQNMIHHLLM